MSLVRVWEVVSGLIIRRTGLYVIDVWLWRRKARQLDELAAVVEGAGLSRQAVLLRDSAAYWRQMADARAAW